MEPVAALEEIAFLLEWDLASTYKTKAFRTAAGALHGFPPEAVSAGLADGSLRRTPGIGDTTYSVVLQASSGAVPDYLEALRERPRTYPRMPSELRSELRGDLHSHSDWSDGTTSIEAMADGAARLDLEYVVISDHSPSLTVAHGLNSERLAQQCEYLEKLNTRLDGIQLLSGIEVDVLADGSLDQTPDMLERLDVVVASVHSKLRMESSEMTERMLRAVTHPATNVLGHCTGRRVLGSRTRPESQFDAERVFAACAENHVAVEINSRPERQDPPDELLGLAVAAGCLFSIDSDAHAPGHYSFLDLGAAKAQQHGIAADRIVTTWPVQRLRDWARSTRSDR